MISSGLRYFTRINRGVEGGGGVRAHPPLTCDTFYFLLFVILKMCLVNRQFPTDSPVVPTHSQSCSHGSGDLTLIRSLDTQTVVSHTRHYYYYYYYYHYYHHHHHHYYHHHHHHHHYYYYYHHHHYYYHHHYHHHHHHHHYYYYYVRL